MHFSNSLKLIMVLTIQTPRSSPKLLNQTFHDEKQHLPIVRLSCNCNTRVFYLRSDEHNLSDKKSKNTTLKVFSYARRVFFCFLIFHNLLITSEKKTRHNFSIIIKTIIIRIFSNSQKFILNKFTRYLLMKIRTCT